ncbi:MAG: hypothetical protein HN611_10300, partial [Gemmatimonadetes bacterium]|nr:hypothetical protein [Gemmatimonadota bacterium]
NIIGFSELILSAKIGATNPDKLNEYITDIYDSGNMLLEFVDNMIGSLKWSHLSGQYSGFAKVYRV